MVLRYAEIGIRVFRSTRKDWVYSAGIIRFDAEVLSSSGIKLYRVLKAHGSDYASLFFFQIASGKESERNSFSKIRQAKFTRTVQSFDAQSAHNNMEGN